MNVELTSRPGRRARGSKLEYWVYFIVIFLFSLPVVAAKSALGLRARGEGRGVFGRAWREAHAITPMIFSA